MNIPGFTADRSLDDSARKYHGRSAATHMSNVITLQTRVGSGGLSNTCDDKWGDCYIDCSVRYPDAPNSLNEELRQGCFDSCDSSHDLCGGAVSLGRKSLVQTRARTFRRFA